MDQFNYLAVLISIILGLGITQLLSGFGRWIEHRTSFRAYAPAICWAFVLLVIQVQCWWAMFGLREQTDWTFLKFMAVLLQPIILYLQAIVVLPGASSTTLDLRSNYYAQRSWFFGLMIALLVASVAKDLILNGGLPETENLAFHGLMLVTAAIAMATDRPRVHEVIAYGSIVLMGSYIWLLFARLQ
jgi:hypothetical protein